MADSIADHPCIRLTSTGNQFLYDCLACSETVLKIESGTELRILRWDIIMYRICTDTENILYRGENWLWIWNSRFSCYYYYYYNIIIIIAVRSSSTSLYYSGAYTIFNTLDRRVAGTKDQTNSGPWDRNQTARETAIICMWLTTGRTTR